MAQLKVQVGREVLCLKGEEDALIVILGVVLFVLSATPTHGGVDWKLIKTSFKGRRVD